MLSAEVGVEFRIHDDGSEPAMPDLLSADRKHAAEVITTAPAARRQAERALDASAEASLPHCIWVIFPYSILGGATKIVRNRIKADILRWTAVAGCENHWSSRNEGDEKLHIELAPIRLLASYDDGVRVLCAQLCQHPAEEPHHIKWSVMHSTSPDDPWTLIQQSLAVVDQEQRGGVDALVKKLDGYTNKHLVMYPFGSPGNVTATLGDFVAPSDTRALMSVNFSSPLAGIHLWLVYKYGTDSATEGIHMCDGHWSRFGTTIPTPGSPTPIHGSHYST